MSDDKPMRRIVGAIIYAIIYAIIGAIVLAIILAIIGAIGGGAIHGWSTWRGGAISGAIGGWRDSGKRTSNRT